MEIINKLKPVVFVKGEYGYTAQNTTQQIMLLRALKITQDPKKLREIIGVKTVADVYRTLDKIAMRKEYHAALAKNGITFDYVVENVKGVIDNAVKDSDRLAGLNMLLKSIGLDKYEETAIGGGSWEEALVKIAEKKREENEDHPRLNIPYQVVSPPVPEEVRIAKEKQIKEGR